MRSLDTQLALASVGRRLLREPRRPVAVRSSPRAHWYVVGTVCIGAVMGQLDASIVTLALPSIGRDLHASVGAVEWVALSYLLVLVATVATVGRIADAVGRKLLYVYGFGVFTAGSVLCGLAPTLPVLIAARVLQAIGAAMLQANSVALIAEAMPPSLLGRGIGVQGGAQALGLALGPAVGGVLLALGGWRLIFLVNLPAGAIGLALGWFLLPRSRSCRELGAADRLGPVLLALAVAGPLVYLSLGSRAGYADGVPLACLAAGVICALAFIRRERRVAVPLIDLSIMRRPALAVGLSSGLVSYMALFGILFAVPYYLSAERVSEAWIGLQLAVLPVAIGVTAPIAGRLVDRLGDGALTAGGLLLAAAGMFEIALRHGTAGILLGLALAGVGLGAFTPANNAGVMSASPPGHAGVVSGLLNMTRGLGTALGVALTGAVFTAVAGISGTNAARASAAATGHGLTAAFGVLGVAAVLTGSALVWRARRGLQAISYDAPARTG
ncbi:MAG TPA: MFS transporter [Solirubrobacteraceae bacterium]|nr:MFS transporter [Solirubrobacteraceae bacterium]